MGLWILPLLTFIILAVIIAVIWLFYDHGANRLKQPEEWQSTGSSGEQIIFLTLNKKLHIPENQILRNVYIPTENGKTSEIDLLVVSKKGLFVFEVKNYAGNIYGDTKRKKWIQYLGKKKSYFYNPFMQNRTHAKNLKKYLEKYGDIPVIPMVTTITRGKWKVKNYGPEDYLLGYNSHLKDIYALTPDSELMAQHFKAILTTLQPLSRPDQSIREEHMAKIKQH